MATAISDNLGNTKVFTVMIRSMSTFSRLKLSEFCLFIQGFDFCSLTEKHTPLTKNQGSSGVPWVLGVEQVTLLATAPYFGLLLLTFFALLPSLLLLLLLAALS